MSTPTRAKLTDRQSLILRLLTDKGLTARQVADALHITTQGVYDHIDAIRAKGYEIRTKEGTKDGKALA